MAEKTVATGLADDNGVYGQWTVDTLRVYILAKMDADHALMSERDRRYAEVALEREKALKIKEQADRDALQLARDIQVYKDEKANELREQISRERGLYATHADVGGAVGKLEATIGPMLTFVAAQQGKSSGLNAGWIYLLGAVAMLGTAVSVAASVIAVVLHFVK